MSDAPAIHPLHAFDIQHDGTARPCADTGTSPAAGSSYRWLHLDLHDPGVAAWCAANLPPVATRVLMAEKTRPRVDLDDTGVLLTLRGVNMNAGSDQTDMVSLRLWATPTLVVTVRRVRVFAMDLIRDAALAGNAPITPAQMITHVSEALVERIETLSLSREDIADDLETTVYEAENPPLLDLPRLRREVIKMRRHLAPMADALTDLANLEHPVLPRDIGIRLRDNASRARRSLEELSEVNERLNALSDHMDLRQAARLERNGYRLSIVAAIFLPLGFLTGLFGVNVGGMPLVSDPYGFWWLTGATVAMALVTALILRLIRWL